MDPATLTAISHVAQATKAVATATVSGPVRRLTLRRRVAFATAREARRRGLRVGYRAVFGWLNATATKERLAAHTTASLTEAVHALSRVLPGPAGDRRDADALVVLKLALYTLLAKSEPSDAVAQSTAWLAADLAAQSAETRALIEETGSQVLRRLDARDTFETKVQTLPPWRQTAATELKTGWPGVERAVELLATAGGEKAAVLRQWSQHTPEWLTDAPASAYLWLGLTAADYGAHDAAVGFLDAALQRGVFPRPYVVARKALALSAADTEAAVKFLRESAEDDPFCRSLETIFDGDSDRACAELDGWTAGTTEEAAIRGTLLTQVLQEGDPNAALAVALETWQDTAATGAGLQAARLSLGRAARGDSASKSSDTQRAAELAVLVRNRRRAWGGDSAEAVEVAVAAAHMSRDPERAWRLTQTPPDGESTEREAADPRVRQHAALTAALRGDVDAARALLDHIAYPFHRAHVQAVIAERSGSKNKALRAWQTAWEAARDDAERLQAASGISTSGGPLPDLAEVAGRHHEAVAEIRLVAEVLAADDQLSALRANMLRSPRVLVELAKRYGDDGLHGDAGEALRRGAEHWSHSELMAMAASSYHWAGMHDQARDAATQALTLGGPGWSGRPAMLTLLVEVEARSENWPAAVTSARQLIDADPDDVDAYWALARCHMGGADLDGAWATLQSARTALTPRSRDEALVWLQLNARYSSDRRFLSDALALMRTWHDDAELLGYFLQLTYTGLRREELAPTPGDLAQLHELTGEYVQQHPDSTTFRSVTLGPEGDPLLPLATELRQQYEQTEQVRRKVADGQLPLAMLATATGRTFTEASLHRVAGVVYAAERPARPEEAVAVALAQTTPTVIDPTVAQTLTLLDTPLRDQLLGSVPSVNTTDPLYRDALQAQDSLALRSTLSVSWDPGQQRPVPVQIDQATADLLAERSRDVAEILAAAARFPHNQQTPLPGRRAPFPVAERHRPREDARMGLLVRRQADATARRLGWRADLRHDRTARPARRRRPGRH